MPGDSLVTILTSEERAIRTVGTSYPFSIYAFAVVALINLDQISLSHNISINIQAVTGPFYRFWRSSWRFWRSSCRFWRWRSCCRFQLCISFALLTIEFLKVSSNPTSFTLKGFVTCFDSTFGTLILSDFCSKVTNFAAKTFWAIVTLTHCDQHCNDDGHQERHLYWRFSSVLCLC